MNVTNLARIIVISYFTTNSLSNKIEAPGAGSFIKFLSLALLIAMFHKKTMNEKIKRMFQCYDEKTIEDMTDEMEMMSNPNLVEKRKEMKEQKSGGPVCILHNHYLSQ